VLEAVTEAVTEGVTEAVTEAVVEGVIDRVIDGLLDEVTEDENEGVVVTVGVIDLEREIEGVLLGMPERLTVALGLEIGQYEIFAHVPLVQPGHELPVGGLLQN